MEEEGGVSFRCNAMPRLVQIDRWLTAKGQPEVPSSCSRLRLFWQMPGKSAKTQMVKCDLARTELL